MTRLRLLIVFATTMVFSSGLSAPILAYEPFDYPAGPTLAGNTNGVGFVGSWEGGGFNAQIHDVFAIAAGPLTFPGLATKGSARVAVAAVANRGIAGMTRFFPTNLAVPGSTYYLSFLHWLDAPQDYASVVIGSGGAKELSIGKSGSVSQYHVSQRGGINRVLSTVDAVVGQTAFLVVKLEFREGPDKFTLFVNPLPGKPEPDSDVVKEDLDLEMADRICLYSRAAWSVDEIRLGFAWRDVTPASLATQK